MINYITSQVLRKSVYCTSQRNGKIVFVVMFITGDEWGNVVFAKTFNGVPLWFN